MRRGSVGPYNQSGIAGVIAAMILILLNTAVWMVMNTAGEASILKRSIRNQVARKSNQRIVDNAPAVMTNFCSDLLLDGSKPRTASVSELRSGNYDISIEFRRVYRQLGLEIDDSTPVELTALLLDSDKLLPQVGVEALSGIQTTLVVGQGQKKASRIFTIPVRIRRPNLADIEIVSCENSEIKNECYMGSVAIESAVPANAVPPSGKDRTPTFDSLDTYGRIGCFAQSLRTEQGCNPESNTLATTIRVCMQWAQLLSQFVATNTPGQPWVGTAAETCGGLANYARVINSCSMVGGTQVAVGGQK